jgi:hypothetical protein
MYASGLRARRRMPVATRRRNPGAGESVAVVTTEGRILAMRLLLTTTLLLALALHWLR